MTLVVCLLIAGLILIVAEMFLPGMVVGSIGAICLVVSVALCYSAQGPLFGTIYLIGVIVASVVVVGLGLKYFPRTAYGQKMVLTSHSKDADESDWLKSLKGKRGVAHTMLRPAGTAMIEGKRIDVVTEGMMVSKDSAIEVIAVEGNRVVVRQV
jgi:membrane-bound serine protease (ClpP class)